MRKIMIKVKYKSLQEKIRSFIAYVKSCIKRAQERVKPYICKYKKLLAAGYKKAMAGNNALPAIKARCNKLVRKTKAHPRAFGVAAVGTSLFILASIVTLPKEVTLVEAESMVTTNVLDDTTDRLNTLQVDLTKLFDAVDAQLLAQEKLALNIERLHGEVDDMKQIAEDLDGDVLWRELIVLIDDVEALKKPSNMLADTELPFEVLGLDFWNGVPLVSVKMGVHNDLMGLGETRSGWRLCDMNVQAGSLVFANKHDEQVYINLQP